MGGRQVSLITVGNGNFPQGREPQAFQAAGGRRPTPMAVNKLPAVQLVSRERGVAFLAPASIMIHTSGRNSMAREADVGCE